MDKIMDFVPLTSLPYINSKLHREVMSCNALSCFVRCFWGSDTPYVHHLSSPVTVTPDACIDLIFRIDYTANSISSGFCGVDDSSFVFSDSFIEGHEVSLFAIRFFSWSAYKFSDESLSGTLNGFFDLSRGFYWIQKSLEQNLFSLKTLGEKICFAEKILIGRLENISENSIFDSSIKYLLCKKGRSPVMDVSKEFLLSSRQLERVYEECLGMSPKKTASLIRYQFLWNKIIKSPKFDVLDAVEEFRYADQSHLLKDFKKHHSMSIREAYEYAMSSIHLNQ